MRRKAPVESETRTNQGRFGSGQSRQEALSQIWKRTKLFTKDIKVNRIFRGIEGTLREGFRVLPTGQKTIFVPCCRSMNRSLSCLFTPFACQAVQGIEIFIIPTTWQAFIGADFSAMAHFSRLRLKVLPRKQAHRSFPVKGINDKSPDVFSRNKSEQSFFVNRIDCWLYAIEQKMRRRMVLWCIKVLLVVSCFLSMELSLFFPGHALHEKGLQRQIDFGTLVNSQQRRTLAVPVINRG